MDASQMQPGCLQRRLVSLAAFAVLVACGGGGGGGDSSIAARQESQPSACSSITHLDVTVTAARPGRAGGEQVQVLSSPRTIDLMTTSTGVLQALGLAPLASGDAAQVRLVAIANRWNQALGLKQRYPDTHAEYLAQCHAAGQTRATPLLLRYGPGDFNCLHQDLYGDRSFPLQAVLLLSQPGRSFDGGELVLTEQRPRMQSRPMVIPLGQGDAAIFAVSQRPVQGARGVYRVNMRHGVSRVHRGTRTTAGIIFHDAT